MGFYEENDWGSEADTVELETFWISGLREVHV